MERFVVHYQRGPFKGYQDVIARDESEARDLFLAGDKLAKIIRVLSMDQAIAQGIQ